MLAHFDNPSIFPFRSAACATRRRSAPSTSFPTRFSATRPVASATLTPSETSTTLTGIGTASRPSSTTTRAGVGSGGRSMCRSTSSRRRFSSMNWESWQSQSSGEILAQLSLKKKVYQSSRQAGSFLESRNFSLFGFRPKSVVVDAAISVSLGVVAFEAALKFERTEKVSF
jgi:hypothetical protein